jgi:hypothetical protein
VLVKIDIRDIIHDHMRTLVNSATGSRSAGDLALFFIVPLIVGVAAVALDVPIRNTAANVLITALAIFTGLLFNLLVLVHGLIRRGDPLVSGAEVELLRQIYANISFAVLISLTSLVPLVLQAVLDASNALGKTLSVLIYFFVVNFILTLMMILKRVHALLGNEFQRPT